VKGPPTLGWGALHVGGLHGPV